MKTQDEAYTILEQTIGACFGSAAGVFAGYPSDELAAKEKRQLMVHNELDKERVKAIVAKYLYEEGFTGPHETVRLSVSGRSCEL
jgi:hypothetical protein